MTSELEEGEKPAVKFTDPFLFDDIEYRAGATNDRKRQAEKAAGKPEPPPRTLAVAYMTVQAAADRLDAVCDSHGWMWSDKYREVFVGDTKISHIECTITIQMSPWQRPHVQFSRSDVGTGHDDGRAADAADPVKTAYSDAFKRATAKLGIGRFLRQLPKEWVEYDIGTKQITDKGYTALRKSFDDFMENGPRRSRRGSGGGGRAEAATAVAATSAPQATGGAQAPQSNGNAPTSIDAPMNPQRWGEFWNKTRGMGWGKEQILARAAVPEEEFSKWPRRKVQQLFDDLKRDAEKA